MNERIKELELEAIAYADSKVPANDRYNDIYHSIVRGKFAELIVKECVGCLSQEHENYKLLGSDYCDNMADGLEEAIELIKEHFGVEE